MPKKCSSGTEWKEPAGKRGYNWEYSIKMHLKKQGMRRGSGFIWLRIRSNNSFCKFGSKCVLRKMDNFMTS
jgi:hypothetical protein